MTGTESNRPPMSWGFGAAVEVACLVLMIGAGLACWGVGVVSRGYDYDEVLRAHSIWLTSKGLRPYSDFFEVHPPYFILLSPIVRAFADPVDALLALRVATSLGNLVFLAGLIRMGASGLLPDAPRRWAWLAVVVVALNPFILDYLVEFRIDGWGYALILWSAWWFCRADRGPVGAFGFGVASGLASAIFAPKMVLLPPLIVLFGLITWFAGWRRFFRGGIAYVGGVGIAGGLFALYLLANGIGLDRTILLLGRYHAVSNARAGFRYGLLHQIAGQSTLLGLTVAGAACWLAGCVRSRRLRGPYEPALAAWLLLQSALVSYPYKQYYAPWFLFASAFSTQLGPVLSSILKRGRWLVFVAAVAVAVPGAARIGRFWAARDAAGSEHRLIRWMGRVAGPEDRVVGYFPYHPINRLDTFFLSMNTTDPNGFDSERIFGEIPPLRPLATGERYGRELEAHPPAFVVLQSSENVVAYPEAMQAALRSHLLREGYRNVRIGAVAFALRPDRFEFARRNGLLP